MTPILHLYDLIVGEKKKLLIFTDVDSDHLFGGRKVVANLGPYPMCHLLLFRAAKWRLKRSKGRQRGPHTEVNFMLFECDLAKKPVCLAGETVTVLEGVLCVVYLKTSFAN